MFILLCHLVREEFEIALCMYEWAQHERLQTASNSRREFEWVGREMNAVFRMRVNVREGTRKKKQRQPSVRINRVTNWKVLHICVCLLSELELLFPRDKYSAQSTCFPLSHTTAIERRAVRKKSQRIKNII